LGDSEAAEIGDWVLTIGSVGAGWETAVISGCTMA
jgi:S1-C subfamily serine protease